eukprot:359300-Chlamydomonas_euryale.AAC.10
MAKPGGAGGNRGGKKRRADPPRHAGIPQCPQDMQHSPVPPRHAALPSAPKTCSTPLFAPVENGAACCLHAQRRWECRRHAATTAT